MSAYTQTPPKQEMPPPGGFEEINYRRIPAQRIFGYKAFFIGSTMLSIYGVYYFNQRKRYLHKLNAEYLDHVIAVEPLVRAEIDRAFLRQLRHNRNVERNLMKNVPDWEVGTLWGSKVYKTLPENALPNVSMEEFYGHRSLSDITEFTKPNRDVGLEDTTINSLS